MSRSFHAIESLYHMTSILNLQSILKRGLFSHNEVIRRHIYREDISLTSVQERRRDKIDPIHTRGIQEYACLYFSPRNPMLFKRRELQGNIVILGLSRDLLEKDSTIFTDGNAASTGTIFFSGLENLELLQWRIINAQYWRDYDDGKRIKCAEVLVYRQIDRDAIIRVYCRTPEQYQRVAAILGISHALLELKPSLFF